MEAIWGGAWLQILQRLIFIVGVLAIVTPAHADDADGTVLSFHTIADVPHHIDITQICCTDIFDLTHAPVVTARTHLGENVTWLRISEPLPAGLIQIKPIVDRATLYAPTTDGGWQTVETGDMVANSAKLFPSPFMTLPMPKIVGAGPVFIRIEQNNTLSLSVSHWDLPAFSAMLSKDQSLKLFLLGFVGAMIIYNLIVSVVVRDPAFALNAVSITALLTLALYLSGYGVAFVWPQFTGISNTIFLVALITAIAAGGVFIWLFVRSAGEPLARGWPLLIAPAAALTLPATLAFSPMWLATVLALGLAALLFSNALILCAIRALRGELKSRIMLLPLVLAMIPGMILVVLDKYFSLRLPQVGSNGMEITLCLEAVLFSLALASRIRITESDARRASERVVALQNEATIKSIAAQDNERKRLATELHDGVGQEFLLVLGGLKQLSKASRTPDLPMRLDSLIGVAGEALGNLRRISRDMHPASLEHLGLRRAIVELVKQTETADRLTINLTDDISDDPLDATRRLHLFRILQECLSNVLRHAHADICWVTLSSQTQTIKLVVEDDGIGLRNMHDSKQITGPGLGLTSIDERVRACKGSWRKGKSKHGGARFEIVLPTHAQKGATG